MAAALQQQLQISGKNNQVGELDLQEQFPAGMRVLVVDDDPTCLRVLEGLLRKCSYRVTTCGKATVALSMLRENRDNFDLVISDVYMPDMDGFKLLELVGLEMDLPVIMMSANGETSAVMKGITHGACDYLLKPVRIEELRNIWQHVVRKKRTETKDMDHSGSVEDERPRRGSDDGDHTSSVNDVSEGNWKISKKRKEEEDNDHESDDPSTLKKQRVVWSVELHQQFVSAVNKLGIDKAVPKRILELMNVQGLTRENVASHLQKYRLYLRRLSGVGHQQQNMGSSFPGTSESSFGHVNSLEGLGDLRALAASGQLSQHALATLQSGLLGRINSTNGVRIGGVDPNMILQMQGGNTYLGRSVNSSFTGASLPCLTGGSDMDHFSQVHQMPTLNQMMVEPINDGGVGALQQQFANAGGISALTSIAGDNEGLATNVNSNPLMQVVQQQQTQPNVRLMTGSGAFSHNNMLSDDLSGGHQSQLGNINTNMDNFPNLESIAQGLGDGGPGSFTANLGSHGREAGGSTSSFISSSIVRGSGHSVDDNAFENRNDGLHAASRALGTKMNGLANHREMPQGWQLPVRNQTHWQSQSSMQSPRYASSHQTMNNVRAHNTGLMLSGSIFSSRFPGEGGPIKSSAVDCNGEQSTAESSYKLTEGQSNLPNVKLEGGMDNGSTTSDDLLSLFLKQQQEGLVFGESDLANDGYLLDKLYVK